MVLPCGGSTGGNQSFVGPYTIHLPGCQKDLAEDGIPEPKPGLVTEAHGGILFIDEIGDMDPFLHNKLLKVLEDKRVYFDSSYYDHDQRIPQYVKRCLTMECQLILY